MGTGRDSLRYTVRRDGAAVYANAYDGEKDVASATIKDPDYGDFRARGFEAPLVDKVDVDRDRWELGIGSRVLDLALNEYPAGTEFLYTTTGDRGKWLMESAKRRHPEFTFSDLPE